MITAVFEDGESYAEATGLTQWDYGQVLRIIGLNCKKPNEIHFAIEGATTAIIQTVTAEENGEITARIPNKLLEKGGNIKAYLYIADADSGETVKIIGMPVKRRQKPDDYDSPAEKNLLRQMIEKLESKADNMKIVEGELQLMSGSKEIGDRIRLPSGGSGGKEIELRNNGTALQWRYTDSNEWTDLILIDDIKGPAGETPTFEIREGNLYAIYK